MRGAPLLYPRGVKEREHTSPQATKSRALDHAGWLEIGARLEDDDFGGGVYRVAHDIQRGIDGVLYDQQR